MAEGKLTIRQTIVGKTLILQKIIRRIDMVSIFPQFVKVFDPSRVVSSQSICSPLGTHQARNVGVLCEQFQEYFSVYKSLGSSFNFL